MKCNADQIIKGIMNYADSEVIEKLPTMGKWVVGTGIGMLSDKANDVVMSLQSNSLLKKIGIVDQDGMMDVDIIAKHMKESAEKYGKAYIDVPLLGSMAFSASDIETLKNYITRA